MVTGDGEMLMGLGTLATMAVQGPANLAVVVFDNERYGETGMQTTHTGLGVDLAAMASGAGIADAATIRDLAGIAQLRDRVHNGAGPIFSVIKVSAERAEMVLPVRDGPLLKHRFRTALLGSPGA